MTREELAAQLNGGKNRNEIDRATAALAKEAGLVVVYGASDDLVEFSGAIDDEAYGPGAVAISREGLLTSKCGEGDDCPYFKETVKAAPTINALWCATKDGPPWTYETAIPHSTFDILEDGKVSCRGIVFALADVTP